MGILTEKILHSSEGYSLPVYTAGNCVGGEGSLEKERHMCLGHCDTVRPVPVPAAGSIRPHDLKGPNLHQGEVPTPAICAPVEEWV